MSSIRAHQSRLRQQKKRLRKERIKFDVLDRFGVSYDKIPVTERAALDPVLDELEQLFDLFPDSKTETLIDWADVFCAENNTSVDFILPKSTRRLNHSSERYDNVTAYAFIGLNLLCLGLTIAGMEGISTDTASNVTDSAWNYSDAMNGFVVAARLLSQGQITAGLGTLTSSLVVTAPTLAANITRYTASSVAGSSMLGFSFAAAWFINAGVESYRAKQCTQQIKNLEEQRRYAIHKEPLLQKAILVQKAKRENHIRNAKSLAACAVAMTAVAVVSYVALSGLSFGTLPLLTIGVGFLATMIGVARKDLISRNDNIKKLKVILQDKKQQKPNLLDRLNRIINKTPFGLDFKKTVTIQTCRLFKTTLSFRSFLEDMLVKQPKTLEQILKLLENPDSKENLLEKLKKLSTTGSKILTLLQPTPKLTDQRIITKPQLC